MEDTLRVGVISSTHGVRGEVKVYPTTDDVNRFKKLKTVILDTGREQMTLSIESVKFFKNMVILKLQGVTDVNRALAMRNAVLYIDRKDVQLPEGSFFLADLMGMEVRDAASGAVLGQIADILTLPANNVYVVRGGARELMIPAVDQFIAEVNVDEGYLRVNMMEGL